MKSCRLDINTERTSVVNKKNVDFLTVYVFLCVVALNLALEPMHAYRMRDVVTITAHYRSTVPTRFACRNSAYARTPNHVCFNP